MYFTLRSEGIYVLLVRLSRAQRILLTGMSVALLWSFWGYCIYYKNSQRIMKCREDIINLRINATRSVRLARETDALQNNTEALFSMIQAHYDMFGDGSSGKMAIQSCLIDVIHAIKQSELTLIGCSTGTSFDKGWYTKHLLHFSVTGTLQSAFSFHSHIKSIHKLIKCTHIRMDRGMEELFNISFDFHVMSLNQKKSLQLETS